MGRVIRDVHVWQNANNGVRLCTNVANASSQELTIDAELRFLAWIDDHVASFRWTVRVRETGECQTGIKSLRTPIPADDWHVTRWRS